LFDGTRTSKHLDWEHYGTIGLLSKDIILAKMIRIPARCLKSNVTRGGKIVELAPIHESPPKRLSKLKKSIKTAMVYG